MGDNHDPYILPDSILLQHLIFFCFLSSLRHKNDAFIGVMVRQKHFAAKLPDFLRELIKKVPWYYWRDWLEFMELNARYSIRRSDKDAWLNKSAGREQQQQLLCERAKSSATRLVLISEAYWTRQPVSPTSSLVASPTAYPVPPLYSDALLSRPNDTTFCHADSSRRADGVEGVRNLRSLDTTTVNVPIAWHSQPWPTAQSPAPFRRRGTVCRRDGITRTDRLRREL